MKNQTKIEEVTTLDISLIDDFEGHPFAVKNDESMEELARSIEENGILNPIIARKKDGDDMKLSRVKLAKAAPKFKGISA